MRGYAPLIAGLFATVMCGAAIAQELVIPEIAYPSIAATAATPEGFAPRGWPIEFKAMGDLDGDGVDDVVLVLRDADPRNIVDNAMFGPPHFNTNPRLLVVALRRPGGGYQRILVDHTLIPRATEPNLDDVFEDGAPPKIQRGALKVELHLFANAGGWTMGSTVYSFRLQQNRFVLIGYDSSMVQRNSGQTEDISINYLTRKRKDATGSIDNDRQKVRWKSLPPAPLLTLDQVGDGMEFDPGQPPS